ncbi:uncharacterized protein F4807DRAFT_408721 [Annulohypoxylon truncatum]|uniref:uncharacterized protein n=1 Tax=Annulohypoxylon truncatum TaxID=327061 RepID=UPI0020077868|nr:uncharacterized protein F4807DRAFT_408721 [Annulohypoxylon truncatum]KAI1213700.1 hypothetical protein F4807DRAFT_408721 [Annulohypoxylon truncatum]
MSTPQTPFPDLPNIDIKFPHSPVAIAALAYAKQHTREATYNHCIRSAYWALILAKKLPQFSPSPSRRELNIETVLVAAILHDMGWATTKGLLSKDKRFEVDGANLAYEFLGRYIGEGDEGALEWDGKGDGDGDGKRQVVWDAIALHCTGSIALHHPRPEVALAHLGIMADFVGPRFRAGDAEGRGQGEGNGEGEVITLQEYREVLARFPMRGFGSDGFREVMCGLCREKPGTTYDNFVGAFGARFGIDGRGGGKEEFRREMEKVDPVGMLLGGLEYLEGLLKEGE